MRTKFIFLIILALGLSGCEKVQVLPIDPNESYIAFYDPTKQYRLCVQTFETNFFYEDENKDRDTVWVKLVSKGAIPPLDGHVKLRAYTNTTSSTLSQMPDAEAGKHYVPFDSKEMQELLIFHKGSMYDSIPVILLRDPSLKKEGRRLTLRIEDSEDLRAADKRPDDSQEHAFIVIYTADCLAQPTTWDYNFFLGEYGPVKHEFIIRHSGERWDTNFIAGIRNNTNMQIFYKYKFRNALVLENAERAKQGLPILQEADGTIVTF